MKIRLLAFFILLIFSGRLFSQNLNVTLSDQLSYGAEKLSNVWHWQDPQDNKEYALVGGADGLSVVDVTNPSNVFEVTQIPGPNCDWREIRTNGNHAYITTECGTIGLQIVDLINLPATNLQTATWKPTISGTPLNTIHSLQIDNGKIYLYGSNVGNKGAIVADITTNPMAPVYLGKYDTRYIHDGYVRNDTLYACHLYDGEVAMVDMNNPNNQTPMATFSTPGNFTHNSWLSENSKVCFTTDEVNDSYLTAYDISNISNISELDRIQSNPGSNSVVHNTYIIKKNGAEYAVTSWYRDGFTVVDVTRPKNLVQVGNYDTAPTQSGSGFNNDWGVDPYLPSGVIVASDITNGLFVCSPTYVRACYLEGVVKDCATGNPISGYTAALQLSSPTSDGHIDISDGLGNYAIGVAAPGTYTVVFTKSGFPTLTYNVTLTAGTVTVLNPTYNCAPFTLTGKVFNTANNGAVPFASVRVQNGSNVFNATTDIAGNFTISSIPSDVYEVVAGKWGFITNCLQAQNLSATSGPVNIGIGAGIYDDFTWDWGWTVGGTASAGNWERGQPLGTIDNSNQANPGADVGSDCSLEAYVTGNTGATGSDDDVDGGDTKLTSPYFNLTSYANPYVYYSRWFYDASGSNPNDTLKIMIDNGATSKILEKISSSSTGNGTWVSKAYKVTSFLTPTANMKITARVEDLSPGHIVEAGFDAFYVLDSALVSGNLVSYDDALMAVYPNPSSGSFNILVGESASHLTRVLSFEVFNLLGEKVHSLVLNDERSSVNLSDVHKGMYLYQIKDGNKIIGAGKLLLE